MVPVMVPVRMYVNAVILVMNSLRLIGKSGGTQFRLPILQSNAFVKGEIKKRLSECQKGKVAILRARSE